MENTPDVTGGDNSKAIAGTQLKKFIERIERLNAEKDGLAADIREIFVEVKAAGLDTKIVRKVIAARKRDTDKLKAERELLGLYAAAIGMDEGIFG